MTADSVQELGVLVVGAPGECAYLLDSIEQAANGGTVTAVEGTPSAQPRGYRLALVDFDIGEWLALWWVHAIREGAPSARVVAIVGHWDEKEYVARRYVDGVLRKPFDIREMRRCLPDMAQPEGSACKVRFADSFTEACDSARMWIPQWERR